MKKLTKSIDELTFNIKSLGQRRGKPPTAEGGNVDDLEDKIAEL